VLALVSRVEALEGRLAARTEIRAAAPMTDGQVAEFRRLLDEEMRKTPHSHRVLYQPPPLTPDQVRYLLRECVTAVGPGETLVIRGRDWTPGQVHEIQRSLDAMHEAGRIPFRALAVFGDELGVVKSGEAAGAA
jgi:hypothetical protein